MIYFKLFNVCVMFTVKESGYYNHKFRSGFRRSGGAYHRLEQWQGMVEQH